MNKVETGRKYEKIGENILIELGYTIVESDLHYQHVFDRIVKDNRTGVIYGVNVKGIESCDYNRVFACSFRNLYRCSKQSLPVLFLVINTFKEYFLFKIDIISQLNKQVDLDKDRYGKVHNYNIRRKKK